MKILFGKKRVELQKEANNTWAYLNMYKTIIDQVLKNPFSTLAEHDRMSLDWMANTIEQSIEASEKLTKGL